jgi:hypothetical protein
MSDRVGARCDGVEPDDGRVVSVIAGAAEHFAAESEILYTVTGSPNQVEAIIANFKNRAPVFGDVGQEVYSALVHPIRHSA